MKSLFLIPARSGSKRLPNKNFKEFYQGRSLVQLAIEHADSVSRSNTRSRIVVSSDRQCPESLSYVDIKWRQRPPELAEDHTPMMPVIRDAIEWIKLATSFDPDFVVLLQPTSPTRKLDTTKRCMALALEKDLPVCTVTEIRHPIGTSVYRYTGGCYVYPIEYIQRGEPTAWFRYEVEQPEDIDIDTKIDWIIAQRLMAPV